MKKKRLSFLKHLLDAVGVKHKDIASIIGISAVAFSNWLSKDDMPLSMIDGICQHLGYSFNISITQAPYSAEPPVSDLGPWRKAFESGRLPFLCQAMATYGISRNDLAGALGLHPTTIDRFIRENDMLLSRVIDIAKAFGLSVAVTITPMKTDMSLIEQPVPRYITTILPLPTLQDISLDEAG